MSIIQEIVARIGADTSGFKKGVDEVAQQSAAMKNNMRVAFSAGYQGAKDLRGALNAVAAAAGSTSGPMGDVVRSAQGLMQAFMTNPMLGLATAAATAVTLIAKQIEASAERALKKTEELIAAGKRTKQMLKTLEPEKYDKVFQAEAEAKKFVENQSDKMLKDKIAAIEQEREAMTQKEKQYEEQRKSLPESISKLQAERSEILKTQISAGPGAAPAPLSDSQQKRLNELNAQIKQQEQTLQIATAMGGEGPMRERQANADQMMRILGIYKDAQQEIEDNRKKAAEDAKKDRDKEQEEFNNRHIDALNKQREANLRKRDADREYMLSSYEAQGKSTLPLRQKFAKEDLDIALTEQARAVGEADKLDAAAKVTEAQTILKKLAVEGNRTAKQEEESRRGQFIQTRDARRNLEITRQGAMGRDTDILRRQYVAQDIQEMEARRRYASPTERAQIEERLINLTEEMVKLTRNIEKKSGKGSRG